MKLPSSMRVLFIGDIVGKSGRNALSEHLPFLREKYHYDMLIVNGENSAHGKGITEKIYNSLVDMGADCVTLGNHAFAKENIYDFIDRADRLVRPENMEPRNVGSSARIIRYHDKKIGIYNIYGNVYMDNATATPFETMEQMMEKYPCDIRIVDFHRETTGEKYTFLHGFYESCAMIVGTHTHVQTADEQIYKGCAFICDVGMCGAYDSVLGRDSDEVVATARTGIRTRYVVSQNKGMVCGVVVDIDLDSGRAESIERIQLLPNIEKQNVHAIMNTKERRSEVKMPVEVNKDLCIGCGACVDVCPVGALQLGEEDGKAESDENICIDCGACMGTCPMEAIGQK